MSWQLKFRIALFLIMAVVLVPRASGSSCCGGSTNFPALMTTDSKAQFSMGVRDQWTVADASRDGQVRRRSSTSRDSIRASSLTAVAQVAEGLQSAIQIPILSREVVAGADPGWQTDLGDISLLGSYEFLPEKTYSPWKPRGFTYLRGVIPSGQSVYEAQDPLLSSISGQGFYSLGVGAAFVKILGLWDVNGHVEWRSLWSRRYRLEGESILISPGPQASGSIGFGYSPNGTKVRLGLSLGPAVTGRVGFSGTRPDSEARWVWDATFSSSYLFTDEWMAAVTYRDQTLWGPARNTPLVREIGLLLQRRISL